MNLSNVDQRLVFDNAKKAIVAAFDGNESVLQTAILTQGDLRLEQLLVAGNTLYTFPTLDQGNANATNMEDRLRLQDAFVISAIKCCVGLPSSSTDNTFLPDSYANPVKYGANAVPLQSVWNAGVLSINVNNSVVLPKWSLYRHYNAPMTQETAALGAGSPGDQDSGATDGWYPVEPNISLIGQKNSILYVNIKGAGLSSISTNSRLIILLRGVLAQNVTVVS
jgi:hypothetical protein